MEFNLYYLISALIFFQLIISSILFIIKMLIQNNFEFNNIFIRGSKSYFLTLLLGNIYLRRWEIFRLEIFIIIICIFIFKIDIRKVFFIYLLLIVLILFKINALSYARKLNMLENNLI